MIPSLNMIETSLGALTVPLTGGLARTIEACAKAGCVPIRSNATGTPRRDHLLSFMMCLTGLAIRKANDMPGMIP